MNRILFTGLIVLSATLMFAQDKSEKNVQLFVQSDLVAYSSLGGWSAWTAARFNRHKFSFAFTRYPNRYREIYNETGIRELDRFARLQYAYYFKPSSKLRNFFLSANVEYHWRQLEEDNNPDEILNDRNWKLGPVIGYEWYPFKRKENAFNRFSLIPWVGLNFRVNNTEQARVFENTGNVYGIQPMFEPAIGLNLSFAFYQKQIDK